MSELPETIKLTGKQNRFLRGLGHGLRPFVMIGKQHLSEEVVKATNEALEAHELIKVRIQEGCLTDRKTVASELAAETGSSVAQILGSTFLLYRPSEEPVIRLPKS
ncbi:MAG: ribosome assembly RNA-binding protein YhbY [Deltaproteobacteria bacterium]|nr:ribosome assembly RNA-binding protein YhbY [Deltaproteobacteria bacterium]